MKVRVDTIREIAANKICTLLSRSEIKDLVDLRELLASGVALDAAIDDGAKRDGGVDAASLAWVLDELSIGPTARLPGGVDPVALEAFRADLVTRLRAIAFEHARKM
ncbi:MAG: nucleotidyl transferase AbiEii/AbiGii toxin family protein [Polyangiales bacterium]